MKTLLRSTFALGALALVAIASSAIFVRPDGSGRVTTSTEVSDALGITPEQLRDLVDANNLEFEVLTAKTFSQPCKNVETGEVVWEPGSKIAGTSLYYESIRKKSGAIKSFRLTGYTANGFVYGDNHCSDGYVFDKSQKTQIINEATALSANGVIVGTVVIH